MGFSKRSLIIGAIVIIALIAALISVKMDFQVIEPDADPQDETPEKDPTLNKYQGFIKGFKWDKVNKQYNKMEPEPGPDPDLVHESLTDQEQNGNE